MTTPWGIGVAVDSVSYFQMANVFAGDSLLQELDSHFPPLYPLALSLISLFTENILTAARVFQGLLIAINGVLAALIVGALTTNRLAAIFFVVLALTLRSEVFFLWHYALSETLFSVFLLGHYLCLIYWQRNRDVRWLLGAGILLGLLMMTRYAGFPFAAITIACIVLFCIHTERNRVARHVVSLITGLLVVIVSWIALALATAIRHKPRSLGFYPPSSENLRDGAYTLIRWVDQGYGSLLAVIVALTVVYATWNFIKSSNLEKNFWVGLFTASIAGYIVFIALSLLFFDGNIKLEERIFYPALLLFLILTVVVLEDQFSREPRTLKFAYLLTLLFVTAGSAPASYSRALVRIHQGEGFTNAIYKNMDVWKRVPRYQNDQIVSNGPELVYLHGGREASLLPMIYDKVNLKPNTNFDQQLLELKTDVSNGSTTVIYFAAMQWREELPSAQHIMDLMQIEPDYLRKKVMIFHVPDAKN